MRTFWRVTLLSTFAAAGVAAAIALAKNGGSLDLPDAAPALAALNAPAAAQGSAAGSSPALGAAAATHEPSADPPPSPVDVRPVASAEPDRGADESQRRIAELERSLDRAVIVAERNELLLGDALDAIERPPAYRFAQAEADPPAGGIAGPEAVQPGAPRIAPGRRSGRLDVNVRDSDLRQVLDYLGEQGEINIVASPSVRGSVTASLSDVTIEEAVRALVQLAGMNVRREGNFLYVGTPAELLVMDQLRDRLVTRVYRPNYVTAADLQALIAPLLTPEAGQLSVSSPAEVDIPADGLHTGGDDFADTEVVLVRDYEAILREIDIVVAEVDRRPRQVAIEAIILSVTLDDKHKLGVNLEAVLNETNTRVVSGSPLVNLGNIDISEGGLNVGFLDSSMAVFIQALESVGDTSVIARPRLLCLNKQRAEILIGDQKGYLSTTQTETATTQSVEFLDLGTQLRIRPFIAADGMIRMEVHPELSTGDVKLLGGFALPEKSVTQVTTNIMCRDGATIVIGGLIREDLSRAVSQIPLIGNVPWAGALFRRNNGSILRNEILVLITPHIVYDPAEQQDGMPAAKDLHDRQAEIFTPRMTPVARRYYGRRYLRLARSAWLAGNAEATLSYIELSLRFWPAQIEAMELRKEVLAAHSAAAPVVTPGGTDWTLPPPVRYEEMPAGEP